MRAMIANKEKQKKSYSICNSCSWSHCSLRLDSDMSCTNPSPVLERVISALYLLKFSSSKACIPFHIPEIYGMVKGVNPCRIPVVVVLDFTKFLISPTLSFELRTTSGNPPSGRETNSSHCFPNIFLQLVRPQGGSRWRVHLEIKLKKSFWAILHAWRVMNSSNQWIALHYKSKQV